MKSSKGTLARSLDQPDPAVRVYLFHGEGEQSSRTLADRLLKSLAAERVVLSSAALKSDPGLLAGEAGSIGLFGGQRAVWVEPAGDEISIAVENLLALSAVESPTILIARSLTKSSALLKIAETHPAAWSHASYPLDPMDADRLVTSLGRVEGLTMSSDVAARVGRVSSHNPAIIAMELTKFALYLGAGPTAVRELDHDVLDHLAAEDGDANWQRTGDLALEGQVIHLCAQLQLLPFYGFEVLSIVRSVQRRVVQLAPLRAAMDSGQSLDAVMASSGKLLFWKDKSMVQRMLALWNSARLSQLGERLARLERELMRAPVPGNAMVGQELLIIARAVPR